MNWKGILFRSKSASNEPHFDIDSTFGMIYQPKAANILEQLISENSDRLENYFHFIRKAERKERLPIHLKLAFLRSLAKQHVFRPP